MYVDMKVCKYICRLVYRCAGMEVCWYVGSIYVKRYVCMKTGRYV